MPADITDFSTPADVYRDAAAANAPQPLPDVPPQPAAPATSTPDQGGIDPALKQAFEGASVKYQVPVNVLMAIGPQDGGRGITPPSAAQPPGRGIVTPQASSAAAAQAIDGMAQQLRGALDKGGSIEDAVQATGHDPSTIIPAAKQIAARLYPLPSPSPAAKPVQATTQPARKKTGSIIGDALAYAGGGVDKAEGGILRGVGELVATIGDKTTTPLLSWITGAKIAHTPNMLAGAADALENYDGHIQSLASQASQDAAVNSRPGEGPMLLGKDPSLRGCLMLGSDLMGEAAPTILSMLLPGGAAARAAAAAGTMGAQGGGQAVEQAHDAIKQMAEDGTLARQSAYYADLIKKGVKPADAVQQTADSAGRWAFLLAAPVNMIGGAVASKIIHPASELATGLNLAGRMTARAGLGAADMSAQNVAQTAAGNEGQNLGAGTDTPVTQGAGAAAVRGLITGAALGAGGGLLSRQAPGTAPENAPAAAAPQPSTGNPGIDAGLAGTPPGFEPAPVPQRLGEEPTVTPGPMVHPASVGRSPASPLSNALARAVPVRAAGVSAPDAMAGGNQPSAGDRAAALAAWQAEHRRPDPQPASAAPAMARASAPDQVAGVPAWAQKYRRDEAASGAGRVIPAIGSRVVVRHFLPGDDGHSFEIIGHITAVSRDTVTVRDDDGEGYEIPRADLESGQTAGGSLTIAPHGDDWGSDTPAEVMVQRAAQAEAARREKWAKVDRVLDAQGTGLRDWLDDRGYLDPSKRSGVR